MKWIPPNRSALTPAGMLILVFSTFLAGCAGSTTSTPPDEEPVTQDGRLETVTWNLEWYGSDSYGPPDEALQTQNMLQVFDSLKADLYALQEVNSQEALNRLLNGMEGYRGFVASHVGWIQKMAFVYNSAAIDSVAAGGITDSEGQDSHDWAGRHPLYFEFSYHYRGHSTPIYAVVIHAKAHTGDAEERQAAYERRSRAADSLYEFLMNRKPGARIILLGDYNDDVDQSIHEGQPTPYDNFVEADRFFRVVTKTLSESRAASTVSYSEMIDHITISDELFEAFLEGSQQVYARPEEFIPSYGSTTSDHYPVRAIFDFTEN